MIKRIPYSHLENDWSLSQYLMDLEKPNYAVKELQKICQINPAEKRVHEDELENVIKVIEISSIDEKGRIIKPKTVESEKEKKNILQKVNYKADKGDILIPLIQVKKFAPVIVDENGLMISSNFAVLESKVSAYYLYWALSQDYVKKQIQLHARGSVIDRIRLSDLKEIKIPWLDKNIRIKIAQLIRHMLEVESFEELNLINKARINNIFESEFGYSKNDLINKAVEGDRNRVTDDGGLEVGSGLQKEVEEIVSLPEGTQVLTLKDVIDYIGLGLNKYRVKEGKKELALIQSRDLGVMQYKDDLESIKLNKAKIKEVIEGDVLMKRKGGVGPAAVFENERISTFDDSIVRIVADENIVKSNYLAMYLNSNLSDYLFKEYLVEKSTTYIKVSDLKKVEILVPSIKRQQELVVEFKGGD